MSSSDMSNNERSEHRQKRQRTVEDSNNHSDFWELVSRWIRSNGGCIHPALELSVLPVNFDVEGDGQNDTPEHERYIQLNRAVTKGTLLMKIPIEALISLKTVERATTGSLGSMLFQIVSSIDDDKLFHSKDDLLIALYLATVSCNIGLFGDDVPAGKDDGDSYEGTKMYLSTLPHNASYDGLPRRWSDEKIERLLKGSSVFKKVHKQKSGFISDYNLLKEGYEKHKCASCKNDKGNLAVEFASIVRFDEMLSAVGSRAFDELGEENIDAMVPLLDLMNHKRGVGQTSDIMYVKGHDGSINVTATNDMAAGQIPGITYGAKGNAQLLVNYGFCLENNYEPDFSSNNVLEFEVNGHSVELRSGPKSYSYGCFVKALELYRPLRDSDGCDRKNDKTDSKEEQSFGGVEDFLDACEEEEGENEEGGAGFDFFNDAGHDGDDDDDDDGKDSDLKALDAFALALTEIKCEYSLSGSLLHDALTSSLPHSNERFCGHLVRSELETVDFYLRAIDLIQQRLSLQSISPSSAKEILDAQLSIFSGGEEDAKLRLGLALQLRDAFCSIRYPLKTKE
uniref:SET domain-containing protein n=1 Tax=Chaetoceros debilis TaxID=122233 RepID=A0A7S3QAP1_9STRA|mmetsp:Transcript_18355/g.27877  ORF Transcript_18355/g.27877 Transcript_18355/m.27877 type:complete len:567 (+) Transcript_18355:4-1704(+)